MIHSLSGMLVGRKENYAFIEVGGIGFKVLLPLRTVHSLPQNGSTIKLFCAMYARESAPFDLFGFLTEQDLYLFEKLNTVIIGMSKDSVKSHDAFKTKYCLPFMLASDESGAACEDYGVWVEKSMYGKTYMGIERSTFLIDTKGTIRQLWRKVKVEGHVQEILKAVQTL